MNSYKKKSVFFAACLAMLIFGIMMTTLGSILPSIFEDYGISKTNAGSLFLFMTFGMLIGSMIFGPVVDRFGYKILLMLCSALIGLCLAGISFAPSFLILRLSIFFIGFGGGVINGGANALVADIAEGDKSADLSLLGVFFCIGAFGVPLLLGSLLRLLYYKTIIAGIGVMVLFPLVFFAMISFPAPKIRQGFPIRQGIGLLKDRRLVILGLILFFESGMEITIGGWVSSFFNQEFHIHLDKAVLLMSFYWLGMMGARIFLNTLLKKYSPEVILLYSIGIAFAGSLLLIFSQNIQLASFGLLLLGIGLAATYPVILGFVGDIYSRLSGTAFSVVLAMALLGGMCIPYFTGVLGNFYGLRKSFLLVSFSLVSIAILFIFNVIRHRDVYKQHI